MTEPDETDEEEVEGAEQLGDAGKRALDAMKAKLKAERARIKELEPLAAKAREADEAAKTQAQKDAEARTAVERERDEARAELLRHHVAAKAGLPAELATRLRGSTEAELEADAKELLKLVPKAPATNVRPVADLRPGALPAADVHSSTFDADAFIRDKARRR